jgi:hypothetical protein
MAPKDATLWFPRSRRVPLVPRDAVQANHVSHTSPASLNPSEEAMSYFTQYVALLAENHTACLLPPQKYRPKSVQSITCIGLRYCGFVLLRWWTSDLYHPRSQPQQAVAYQLFFCMHES